MKTLVDVHCNNESCENNVCWLSIKLDSVEKELIYEGWLVEDDKNICPECKPMPTMDVIAFLNIICPKHDRTSCSDKLIRNGFHTNSGSEFCYGRCRRCMYLQIITEKGAPDDFDSEELW